MRMHVNYVVAILQIYCKIIHDHTSANMASVGGGSQQRTTARVLLIPDKGPLLETSNLFV
jgi:hypothetical protein